MTYFQAFIFFAANIDNTKLSTAVRRPMQAAYNVIKDYEKRIKSKTWRGDREALVNDWMPGAKRNFINNVQIAKSALDALKPVEIKKEAVTAAFFKQPGKTAAELRAEALKRYGTSEKPVVIVSRPVAEVAVGYIKPGFIPPAVAAVDAGYMPAVDPTDVQSKTDVSGRLVAAIADPFRITVSEIPRIKGTEELYRAAMIPDFAVSKKTAVVIAAILLFFLISR